MVVWVRLQGLMARHLSWSLQKVSAFSVFALKAPVPPPLVKSCVCAVNVIHLLIHREELAL